MLSLRISSKQVDIDGSTVLDQPDLLPVPRDSNLRTWNMAHMGGFWIAMAFSISQYQIAATAVQAGLSPGAAIGAVFVGHFIISLGCAATGWIGATHGINFPIFARASFGVYGNIIAVVARAVSGVAWFGLNTYQGGQCLQVMLGAIFPSFKSFKNHLPHSAHVTSSQLLCFFIFYIIQLPLLYIHISKLRHLFMFKIILMPIFGIALFSWAVGRAHGFGPLLAQKTNVHGSPVALVFISAVSSNICDFSRYAKSPSVVVWGTIFSLSILLTLCAILGVVVTSAVQVIYGVSTWNPLQVTELWSNRAAQFFAAFCWALGAIVSNLSANSTAVGNDLAILFPRYINVRRGQYVCAIVSLATCPWIIQNSATSFTSFLGGYTIFLAPICGILLSDYFIRQHWRLEVAALYRRESSRYWYTHGVNWRAVAAFMLALIPSLPGFAAKINTKIKVPIGAKYIFALVWPVGVIVGGACYLLFSAVWPARSPKLERPKPVKIPSFLSDGDLEKH